MSESRGINWKLVVGAWALVAGLLAARSLLQFGTMPLLGDSDDAMRIVTATDLLNGQGWQDIVQHRDNAPFGSDMHWSRLIDAPIALIMALAQPFAGTAAADVAAIVWPLILLLPLMALTTAIVQRLVPDADGVTALALPAISLVLLIEFLPGRVDHHNVQILLMLSAMLALLVWRHRIIGGVIAGLALATSIAIGLETVPFVAVALATMATLWAFDPDRYWQPAVALGITLAAGTLAHFLIAVAPERYATAACDMISVTYVVAIGLGGLTFAAVAALATPVRLVEARLTAMVVAGGVVATISAIVFPACLSGPYGDLDPRIAATFAVIPEVQSLGQRILADPATGFAFGFPALVALVLVVILVIRNRGEHRTDWLIAGLFLLTSVALMMVQIRGARFAAAFALPAAAWLITEARRDYVAKGSVLRIAGLVGSWLLFASVLQFALVRLIAPGSATAASAPFADIACFNAEDYDQLAALPVGIVMAPPRNGSHILRYTPHAIVSAGFHRNAAGTIDVLDFFGTDEAKAREIAEKRGITYVVDCANGNAVKLTEWEWLTALPGEGALSVYEVNF